MTYTQQKLLYASIMLKQAKQNSNDYYVFIANLDAFVTDARSVTFIMQTEYNAAAGFEEWYKSKQEEMKDDHDMPILPYQKTLYDALQNHKHIWIKKSRGLGVTEFLLRYVAWCCFATKFNSKFGTDARVYIVTGPRIDLAEDLIARFKA